MSKGFIERVRWSKGKESAKEGLRLDSIVCIPISMREKADIRRRFRVGRSIEREWICWKNGHYYFFVVVFVGKYIIFV